jgi:hypothetical protein
MPGNAIPAGILNRINRIFRIEEEMQRNRGFAFPKIPLILLILSNHD